MMTREAGLTIDDVLVTEELARRPVRARNDSAEREALVALAREMAANPRGVLQKLSGLVVALCGADSAGISILEPGGEHGVLRWHAIAGRFAAHLDGILPREESPCGIVLDRNRVLLFDRAGRYFPAMRDLDPDVCESLLAPWTVDGKPAGTVWAMAHTPDRHFDAEDARLLESLSNFAAAAWQTVSALDDVRRSEQAFDRRIDERTRLLTHSIAALQKEIQQHRHTETALHATEARLRLNERRQAFLLELSDALRTPTDSAAIEAVVTRLTGRHLEANRVLVGEFDGDDVLVARDYTNGVASLAGRHRAPSFGSTLLAASERGAPFVVDDVRSDARLDEAMRARWLDADIGALLAIGLFGGGQMKAAFAVHCRTPRRWSQAEAALVRDVAERAWPAIERARAEAALKDADRRKDEFLATLAHELRNPLAPISNAVHLMRRPDGRRATDRLMGIVERQVQQIVKLVDDLLEISRITRGKIELDRKPVALAEVVRDALETSRPLVERGQHQLSVGLPDEPLVLDADAVRLTQVLSNLVNNAAKYTAPGGHIRLEATRENGEVAIRVSDNGLGIPPDALPHVFEMFAQAHAPGAAGSGDGLGIGLAIVRKLVEMHGGHVEARSGGPGRGSEFTVRLPLPGIAAAARAIFAEMPRGSLHNLRILVVDDNRDAADTLALLLESHGATVRVAYGGQAALAALDDYEADAVLLDLGMPGMDGFAVARRLRADPRHAALRILALTGWGQAADRQRTREAGFDHHLTKPVDFEALETWLAGS